MHVKNYLKVSTKKLKSKFLDESPNKFDVFALNVQSTLSLMKTRKIAALRAAFF